LPKVELDSYPTTYIYMTSRVYIIRETTPNESIINVMINGDATNTIF